MSQSYGVYFGNQLAGKVQVQRQGLYYRFQCRCQLTGDVICRLVVRCGGQEVPLGVVVPMDGGFGLDTRLAAKHLGAGELEFRLVPKHAQPKEQFCPIYPEEPFDYIARLKEGFLAQKDGQPGLMLPEK